MITYEQEKKLLTKYLANKCDVKFFGKVMIVFQDGKVTHIIEEKSLVLESLKN